MEEIEKKQIVEDVKRYVAHYPSQNKAAASLSGISAGTLSSILNGNWTNISDAMWKKLADQVKRNTVEATGWNIVETTAYQEITYAMNDAQDSKNVTWIVGEAGSGKTTTAKLYTDTHKEVFYILCSEDMYKGEFVRTIAKKIGIRGEGCTVRELWMEILDNLVQMDSPLLVFDEADKLTERVFHYFISLYNNLEDKCGVIFLSTDYIKRRIRNGLRYEKPGYKEFYSRIGRKFYEIEPTSPQDVYSICASNGITDRKEIDRIIKESESCEYDLRRVKKSVHRAKRIKE